MMTPCQYTDNFNGDFQIRFYQKEVFVEKKFGQYLIDLFNEGRVKRLIKSLTLFFEKNYSGSDNYNPIKKFYLEDDGEKVDMFFKLIEYLRNKVFLRIFSMFSQETIETKTCLACMVRYSFGRLIGDIDGD